MYPTVIIEDGPESVLLEPLQIHKDGYECVLDALFVECANEMVMVDDVVPILRSQDDRDQVLREEVHISPL